MTKKEWKIIKDVLNPRKPELSKFAVIDGYYYATDMYRIIRCEEGVYPLCAGVEIPTFAEGEKYPDYLRYFKKLSGSELSSVEIPYTPKELRDWNKCNYKENHVELPFKLGVKQGWNYIAININYLADAMETCKTNTVYIPERFGDPLLVSGNNYTWLIMPVMLQGFERDKHMTEIFENVSVEEVRTWKR